MSLKVEFHFDFGSPNAYFAHRVIPGIEQRTGVRFDYVPVLIGGVFKATNNKSPMETLAGVKNKPEYNAIETERFKRKHDIVEFRWNPFFPVNTLTIMRGAIHARNAGFGPAYIDAIYRGLWEQELNLADVSVIESALLAADMPAREILEKTTEETIKLQLIDNTSRSVSRGSFGSPTFFVGNEIYFGKDRLREVEEEIISQLGSA